MSELLPLFLNLAGRRVLLVGGGPVAASKLAPLLAAGAHVRVVAPEVRCGDRAARASRDHRPPRRSSRADLDGAWLVVAAATPEVNRAVADGGRGAARVRERRRRSGRTRRRF